MTTKPCEGCGGTGHRKVGPIEAFKDDLRARGVWFRVEGHVHEARLEESTYAVVVLHNASGAALSVDFGDVLDDVAAQNARIEKFGAILAQFGGWEILARA